MRICFCKIAFFSALVLLCATAELGAVVLEYGGQFDLAIPDQAGESSGWMDFALIDIEDHFAIGDLDVLIDVTHTSVFDLQIYLYGPDGTAMRLVGYDEPGDFFSGADYSETIFDDEASVYIDDGASPFAGRFRPMSGYSLDAFDGVDIYGQWRLGIYDNAIFDTGTLNKFELYVTTPEPGTIILLSQGVLIFFRRKKDYRRFIR